MDGQNQTPGGTSDPNHFEPDTPISTQVQQPTPAPAPLPTPQPIPQPEEQHFIRQDPVETVSSPYDEPDDAPHQPQEHDEVTWQAAEFVAHSKSAAWYLGLVGVTIAVAVLAYLIGRDIVTVIVIFICAGLFGYMAARQPRQLEYALDPKGVYIGNKFYPFADFSAFTVVNEPSSYSINFMPLKRFSPILSVAYDPEMEQPILEVLSQHLPYANHKSTLTDDLMHRIHF